MADNENNSNNNNNESVDEDSFDAFPLITSSSGHSTLGEAVIKKEPESENVEIPEMEEGDYDPIAIESVSLEVLTTRIRRIFQEIMLRGLNSANQLFNIATKIVYRSTLFDECTVFNPVINAICKGITMVLLCTKERDEECQLAEKNVMMFVAKLGVVCKSQGCHGLLDRLFIMIDKYFYDPETCIRQRFCNLITVILVESNIIRDIETENADNNHLFGDEIDTPEAEALIPEGVYEQWIKKLSNSVLDKSPEVRASAVRALAQLDHDREFVNIEGNEMTPNKLITKSMSDIDEMVRCMAVKCVNIVDEQDIDKCLLFIEKCTENKIRHLMVVRLASDVHLLSFSKKQRFRLVNILINSDSARMQDVIHQHLVESWMKVANENIDSLSIFQFDAIEQEVIKVDDDVLEGFPSKILEYLSPIEDPQAVAILFKFATTRYIRLSTSKNTNSIDFECFLKNLTGMSVSQSENLALLTRTTFRLLPEWDSDEDNDYEFWLEKTFYRIFVTRYFLEVIFQLTAENTAENVSIRDRTLRYLVLGVGPLAGHVEKFCEFYFRNDEYVEEHGETLEVLLANFLHIFNIIIKENDDSFDKTMYRKLLETLLEDGSMTFSNEIVNFMLKTKLNLCGDDRMDIQEACDWACYAANSLLMIDSDGNPIGDDLKHAFENNLVRSCMMRRCSAMLLAICQHQKVEKSSVLMVTLFKTLLPALLSNNNDDVKFEGIELIGYSAVVDFDNSSAYLKLVRLLMINSRDQNLKATAINALVRVVKKHGFEAVATSLYELEAEIDSDFPSMLAEMFESEIKKISGIGLIQSVRDILSMMSHRKFYWPQMLAIIMKICFSPTYKAQLRKFFKKFCQISVKTLFNRVHLMKSFLECIESYESAPDIDRKTTDIAIVDMTAFICEHLSSVETEDEDTAPPNPNQDEELFVEAELCRRFVNATILEPFSTQIRNVFSSFATSLSLYSVPLVQLNEIRDQVIIACNLVSTQNARVAQLAVKRFLTNCEKTIAFKQKIEQLKNGGVIEVKKEVEDIEEPKTQKRLKSGGNGDEHTPIKKGKKIQTDESWDDTEDCLLVMDSDEKFGEKVATKRRVTRSQRKRNSTDDASNAAKKPFLKYNDDDLDLDDSF